jgi:hypothetical protein
MDTTIFTTTDKFGRTKQFYNSDKHISGNTRVKERCSYQYDFIWQYLGKDDYDGVRMERCIAIDDGEFADLKARGVEYYECHYDGNRWFRISLEEFERWAHPVTTKAFGTQRCVAWHHWDNNIGENTPAPTKIKRTRKSRKSTLSIREPELAALQAGML